MTQVSKDVSPLGNGGINTMPVCKAVCVKLVGVAKCVCVCVLPTLEEEAME